jgi:hypothetical protein
LVAISLPNSADPIRPAHVCKALLAALDAAEGRRRRRKRDTTPDAIGLALKRLLLEQAVQEDPSCEIFEEWLLQRAVLIANTAQSPGAVAAMARSIYEEWQMVHALKNFREWLESGAPSDDALEEEKSSNSARDRMIDNAGR